MLETTLRKSNEWGLIWSNVNFLPIYVNYYFSRDSEKLQISRVNFCGKNKLERFMK